MKQSEEDELKKLDHLYRTLGVDRRQRERMNYLSAKKMGEVSSLASKLANSFAKKTTKVA